jgi:hypothetical protein
MLGRETMEIRGIADEHTVMMDQIFFQGTGVVLFHVAEHEIGLCEHHINADSQKLLSQSLCLNEVRTTDELVMTEQKLTSLNGQR